MKLITIEKIVEILNGKSEHYNDKQLIEVLTFLRDLNLFARLMKMKLLDVWSVHEYYGYAHIAKARKIEDNKIPKLIFNIKND